MKNIEKYPNTNDALAAYNALDLKKVPFGVWLECKFEEPRVTTLLEAAHQREVAELRECLREAVTEVCNRLEKCGFKEPCVFKTCYVQKWRKALKGSSND